MKKATKSRPTHLTAGDIARKAGCSITTVIGISEREGFKPDASTPHTIMWSMASSKQLVSTCRKRAGKRGRPVKAVA